MEMKTTLNSAYLLSEKPQGVFIGTRGKGGQGVNPDPKYGRGSGNAVKAAFPRLF